MPEDFYLGVNYWPAESGVNWWEEFRLEEVARDLALMRGMGLNSVRVFLRWQDFQPAPDRVSEDALANFGRLADLARRNRLRLIPTLFTGHMSGENWDVPWRRGRCPYTDPDLLRAQLRLVAELAGRYGRHPAVAAWDLANEHDNFVPLPSASAGWLWAHLLTREIQHLARQPVVLGTHITSFTCRDAFRYPDLGQIHDLLCVHPYPMYSELCPGRPSLPPSTLFPSFCLKLARALGGRPVLLEEFGLSTAVASEEEVKAYFQTALYSALAAGCSGALAWCFADFKRTHRKPYATVPHEIGFGLTRDGRPKGAGAAMADFAAALSYLPLSGVEPLPAPAAILLPARYYDHPEPGFAPHRLFGLLFAAYVLAKQAGLDVEFVSPEATLERFRLVICPGMPRRGSLDLPHWEKLGEYVRGGGNLYFSFAGAALPEMETVFGVRLLYPEAVNTAGGALPRTRLVVRPHTARVLYAAPDDHPLALENRYGSGYALLVTEPVETRLASSPQDLPTNSFYRLYRRAAAFAGLDVRLWGAGNGTEDQPPLPIAEPPEEAGPVGGEAKLLTPLHAPERKPWLLLVSHSERQDYWPNPHRAAWQDLSTGELFTGPIPLAPHQGRLLRQRDED
ncbi:MAG: hypothetical protein QHH27_03400 [Clostridia bacterium]|jgi:beta-galactosidase|nr:hypothetical protein [Clostridia bacterium]MDH7572583.1 hypothetical protein [Clostridia bacterium]